MSDAPEQPEQSEALDADKVSSEYPPDEPWGVDEPEVTQDGEWAQESFEERTERHVPPGQDSDDSEDRRAIQPYVDPSQDVLDDEAQAVAEADPPERGERYQLPGESVPDPAEEAALHIEE